MEFVNKGLSNIVIIGLIFIAVVFLINILPIVLLASAGLFGISWIVKKARMFAKDKKIIKNKFKDVEIVTDYDISEKKVIDVEYTEI